MGDKTTDLQHLDTTSLAALLKRTSPPRAAELLAAMPPARAARILEALPADVRAPIMAAAPAGTDWADVWCQRATGPDQGRAQATASSSADRASGNRVALGG